MALTFVYDGTTYTVDDFTKSIYELNKSTATPPEDTTGTQYNIDSDNLTVVAVENVQLNPASDFITGFKSSIYDNIKKFGLLCRSSNGNYLDVRVYRDVLASNTYQLFTAYLLNPEDALAMYLGNLRWFTPIVSGAVAFPGVTINVETY